MERQSICVHTTVADDGRLLCTKISRGDREVSSGLCASCPAAQCNCTSLRFSLEKESPGAIVIRYGNGKTVLWDARPPSLRFARAACVARAMALGSVNDCAGCLRRVPVVAQAVVAEPRRTGSHPQVVAAVSPPASVGKVIPFPAGDGRRQAVRHE